MAQMEKIDRRGLSDTELMTSSRVEGQCGHGNAYAWKTLASLHAMGSVMARRGSASRLVFTDYIA